MLERLKRESPEHDDMVNQLHQMQDNVHYTFFECFLTLAGQLFYFRNRFLIPQLIPHSDHLSLCNGVSESEFRTNVSLFLFSTFRQFLLAENLEKLAFELSRTPQPDESAEADMDLEQPGPERFMGLIAGNEVTSHHQRFLMVLSNAGFCNSHLLPELSRKYQHVWSYAG